MRALAAALLLAAMGCAQAQEQEADALPVPQETSAAEEAREVERGLASWYGPRFHGRRTASGEPYDMQTI